MEGIYLLPLDPTRSGEADPAPILEQVRALVPDAVLVLDAGQEAVRVPGAVRIGVVGDGDIDQGGYEHLILNKTGGGGTLEKNLLGAIPRLSLAEVDLRVRRLVEQIQIPRGGGDRG